MPSPSLVDRLGHSFRNPELLRHALTHRSHGATHNERLEFIGDAVLNCVAAAVLFERFPSIPEGDLTVPEVNICYGAKILAHALGRTGGDLDRALLRYNGCVVGENTPDCHDYPSWVRRARASVAAAREVPVDDPVPAA